MPADDALALTVVFGILGFILPSAYFYRQWSELRAAGFLRTVKV